MYVMYVTLYMYVVYTVDTVVGKKVNMCKKVVIDLLDIHPYYLLLITVAYDTACVNIKYSVCTTCVCIHIIYVCVPHTTCNPFVFDLSDV